MFSTSHYAVVTVQRRGHNRIGNPLPVATHGGCVSRRADLDDSEVITHNGITIARWDAATGWTDNGVDEIDITIED